MLKPIMTCMLDLDSLIVCGSFNGDLLFVKSSALYLIKDHLLEKSKQKMGLAKSYTALTSFVNQIEFQKRRIESSKNPLDRLQNESESYQHFLYTSGISDEVILKWRFDEESPFWELDCNPLGTGAGMNGVEIAKKFNELVKEVNVLI
jgi:hypothetical protein